MDFIWPRNLIPDETEWRLTDFTAMFANPFGGGIRTVSRGQRWACSMRFLDVGGREDGEKKQRSQLLAVIAALRGRANRIYLSDMGTPLVGSMPAPELITDPFPVASVSPWTASNAELVLSADRHNGLRLSRTGVTANRTAGHGATAVTNGARYAFRALFQAGKGGFSASLFVGTSDGGSNVLSGATVTTSGLVVETFSASDSTLYPSIYDRSSGRSAGDFWHATGLSLSRCGRVHTTVPAGSLAMIIKDLPTSNAGLALAGDLFEVGGELHRFTANLESDSSGNAYAMFEPALRAQQLADVPVIFRDPLGRFALAEEVSWVTRARNLTDVSLTFVEA